jgi:hypothetical protein
VIQLGASGNAACPDAIFAPNGGLKIRQRPEMKRPAMPAFSSR